MKESTTNNLKKIPFLKNVDFEDPKARKTVVYVFLLAVLVILLVVALIFRATRADNPKGGPGVELLQGDRRDPNIEQTQTTPVLEIPEGRDRDILGADNQMEAYGGRRDRSQGNRDLYERAARGGDDPIGDIFSGSNGYRGYETPGSDLAAQAAQEEQSQAQNTSQATSTSSRRSSSAYSSSSAAARREALEAFGLGSGSDSGESYGTSSSAGGSSSSSRSSGSRRDELEAQGYSQTVTEEEEEATAPEQTRVRRPNGITTLDDVAPRGSVLTSLTYEGNDSQYIDTSDDALFKVMFLEGKKLKNGDKVRIMLIDDIVVDGILVEHNTPLTATCSLSDRLMLTIPSVTINGRIHTLNFQAVDNDGQVGLYCPVTDAAVKTEQMSDVVSSVAQSELMSLVSGVGGRLLQSGARTMKSGTKGSATVTVDQGYQFYITKNKRGF